MMVMLLSKMVMFSPNVVLVSLPHAGLLCTTVWLKLMWQSPGVASRAGDDGEDGDGDDGEEEDQGVDQGRPLEQGAIIGRNGIEHRGGKKGGEKRNNLTTT